MTNITTRSKSLESTTDSAVHLFDNWFDPIESGVRERVREFIEALICGELDEALARPRYGRAKEIDSGPATSRSCAVRRRHRMFFQMIGCQLHIPLTIGHILMG